ncbi:hypothetical protein [Kitasatospora terrestris]|uniref:Uncharacterized protein n=1 Tax=Kitasatospora terrestris TaxID=258051 RepID=A0ABP9ECV8_9ACTN
MLPRAAAPAAPCAVPVPGALLIPGSLPVPVSTRLVPDAGSSPSSSALPR